jgi:pimeloyl-ACP methyl ester carboxylesterase
MAVSPFEKDAAVPRLDVFRAVTREARAFARLAVLVPRDLAADVPETVEDGDHVIILVHGALATAGAWRPLRRKLEALGRTHTATFSYGPTKGVAAIANSIGELTQKIGGRVRLHLVGHSLGGLAVRWFVQETRSDPRVVQTITVAAPFLGARGAFLFPGPAGRDMKEGSVVLSQLARSAADPALPHLSILGNADTAVALHSFFPVGERVVVGNAAHNALLFDEDVARHIVARVERFATEAAPPSLSIPSSSAAAAR